MAKQPIRKSGHGGKRPGAGRKKKTATSSTKLSELDLKAALEQETDDPEALTEGNAKASIDSLVKVMVHGESDPSRVTACCRIWDRAFGKPSVDLGGTLDLFAGSRPKPAGAFDPREYARKFSALAITVLQKIRDNSPIASARVAASAALLDRECGTVAVAKATEGTHLPASGLGKKEQVAQAAHQAAAGIFSTPPAPRPEQRVQ